MDSCHQQKSITTNGEIRKDPSPTVIAASLLLALVYGILHTLGPGHGKMVVAGYFLNHKATLYRGFFVGAQVAIAHVASAVLIVLISDITIRHMLLDPLAQAYWLKIISYGIVTLIGLWMLYQGIAHACGKPDCTDTSHQHHIHNKKHTWRDFLMGWGIGIVPCTGSLLILLYAMANNILWLGMLMVATVAVGMTLTMTMIGMLVILTERKFASSNDHRGIKITIEIVSAMIISVFGALLLTASVL